MYFLGITLTVGKNANVLRPTMAGHTFTSYSAFKIVLARRIGGERFVLSAVKPAGLVLRNAVSISCLNSKASSFPIQHSLYYAHHNKADDVSRMLS